MRVQVSIKYKNYPQSPYLTKKSKVIGSLTTPWVGLILGAFLTALPMMVLQFVFPFGHNTFEVAYVITMVIAPLAFILSLVLMPVIRKRKFKKLDKMYEDMLCGKIPLK